MNYLPYWLEVAQGLLTPTIAIITTYVAWRQWRATQLKMKMERYDRRLRIYQEARRFILEVTGDLRPAFPLIREFLVATTEADFLYPTEVRKYLDELANRAIRLLWANNEYRDCTQYLPQGYDHQKVCAVIHEQTKWFLDQPNAAVEKFKPFLNIAK